MRFFTAKAGSIGWRHEAAPRPISGSGLRRSRLRSGVCPIRRAARCETRRLRRASSLNMQAVAPGGTVTVALNENIRKTWHTYWVNPGDSGAPTAITWHLPPGWTAGEIQWPYPKRLPVGPLMNFGYEDQVALLSDLKAPADAKPGDKATLSADVMWLVCSDVCIPEETHLSLALAVAPTGPAAGRQGRCPLRRSARQASPRLALARDLRCRRQEICAPHPKPRARHRQTAPDGILSVYGWHGGSGRSPAGGDQRQGLRDSEPDRLQARQEGQARSNRQTCRPVGAHRRRWPRRCAEYRGGTRRRARCLR